MSRSGIAAHAASMTGATVISKAIGMARGFLLARILGPAGYGSLNGTLLITEYAQHSHMGVLNGMARDMPIAIGAGDASQARLISMTSLGFSLATSLVVALGICLTVAVGAVPEGLRAAVLWTAPAVVAQQMIGFLYDLARVRLQFHVMSAVTIANTALGLLGAVALGWLFGVAGVIAGIALAEAVTVAVGWLWLKPAIRPRLDPPILKPLLRLGLSLLWVTSLYTILTSLGRIMILRWMTTEDLGLYAIGLLAVSLLAFVPGAVGKVVSPRIMRAYGSGDGRRLDLLLQEPIVMLGLLLPIMAGFGAVLMPAVIHAFLPKFEAAVLPGQILLLCYTPYAVRAFSTEVLIASSRIRRIAVLQIGAIALTAALNGLAIALDSGITGIAISTGAAYWFLGVSMLVSSLRVRGHGVRSTFRFAIRALWPTVWVGTSAIALLALFRANGIAATEPLGSVLLTSGMALAAAPLGLLGWARYRRFGPGKAAPA